MSEREIEHMQETLPNRTWAEVNLDHIAHNIKKIQEKISNGAEIMGVVKADAYGHGAAGIIPTLIESGVTRLAVAMLDEAIELRRSGITLPILVLNHTDPHRAEEILQYDVTQTVFSKELALALSRSAMEENREARIHIKIDTGMGRVGFAPSADALRAIEEIKALPGIFIEGLFTHFATADEEDTAYTFLQFEKFTRFCCELEQREVYIPIKHVCNSAATIRFPEMHLNMVRVGILLYGLSPSSFCNAIKNGFRPAMTLKTSIVHVKEMGIGQSVSYGRTFVTDRKSLIATLPIGYADGYSRTLSNKGIVLIHGKRYPIVGTVCMDICMADVTGSVANDESTDELSGAANGELNSAANGEMNDKMNGEANREANREMNGEGNDDANSEVKGLKNFNMTGSEVNVNSTPIQVGDEAVLFGPQGEAFLDIDEIALLRKTINYEVTCNIAKRVPRAYFKNGKQVGMKNYLI